MSLTSGSEAPRTLLRQGLSIVVFVLVSTSLLAQDFLSEFVDVTTRKHVDESLGFNVEYPYEWEPSSNPLAESDFYVGAPYAMPSFWLNVSDVPADTALENSLDSIDLSQYPEHKELKLERIELDGHDAMMGVIQWVTPDAGRHFIETTVISLYANDRWYLLTVNQSDRDTRWRPRLKAILDSFNVLERDS